MNTDKIGTIQVSKYDALHACNDALKNISLFRGKIKKGRVLYWQSVFNKEGTIYKIKKFFNRAPAKLNLEETEKRVDYLRKKYAANNHFGSIFNPYWYNSYEWYDEECKLNKIIKCCKSNILEPITLEIDVWNMILRTSAYTSEELDGLIKETFDEIKSII